MISSVVPICKNLNRGPVSHAAKRQSNLLGNELRPDADSPNHVPRERLVHQELRLLSFLDLGRTEVARFHGWPVHLSKLIQLRPKRSIHCPGVRESKRPA